MKQLILFVILLALVAVGACSAPAPRCLKSNCSGCCDVNGLCQPGSERFACGVSAAMCTSCAPNEACASGTCVSGDGGVGGGQGGAGGTGGTGSCGPSTCGGCCDNGTCRGGNTSALCGSRGVACTPCPSGQACTFQDGGTFSCAPYACPGCIGSTGACLGGTSISACGTNGAACRACLTGEQCNMGQCQPADGCDPASCAAGCCNGSVCVDPPTASQCGLNGATCLQCPGGQTCNAATGQCGTPGSGGGAGGGSGSGCAATCTGCCALGICFPGTADQGCGKNGESCTPCPTPVKFYCRNQTCTFVP